jgi:hypothetical protein
MRSLVCRRLTLFGATLTLAACGGGGDAGTPTTPSGGATNPPPATTTSISIALSRDSLVMDTWGDTTTVQATVRNQAGTTLSNATLRWESLDAATATVSGTGQVSSVKVGSTKVRVTASVAGVTDASAELSVRVALQRNPACRVPVAATRGSAQGAPNYGSAFTILPGIPAVSWPGYRAIGVDYDGDGDTDLLRLEYMYPSSPGPYQKGVVKLFRNDNASFTDVSSTVLSAPVGPDHQRDFEVRDFTGDGIADVYVAVHGYDASPFPGAPNLFFTKSGTQFVESAATAFAPYQTNGFTHGTAAADVDCDGDLDIVEIQANQNVPSNLFLNNGSGKFTLAPASAFPPGSGTQRYQEGEFLDFDNDGDPDLYLGCQSNTLCTGDVLYVNDGFGRFRIGSGITLPAPGYTPVHAINQAKSADFNGDGWADLLTFEIDKPFTSTSKIRLWINQKNGSFTDQSAAWGLPTTCSTEMIEPLFIRDMNNDGWPDVMLRERCAELANSSGILFNRGTGFTYFPYTNIQSYLQYDEATPADVNGDGKLDLLFATRGGDRGWVRQP